MNLIRPMMFTWLNRVAFWNVMARRNSLPNHSENQLSFIKEELREFMEAPTVRLQLDGLIDVVVTAYQANIDDSSIYLSQNIIENAVTWDGTKEHALGIAIAGLSVLAEKHDINVPLAVELVLENNDQKFIHANDINKLRATLDMYNARKESVYATVCEGRPEYMVVLRTSDDKVMKPAGFPDVDLSRCFTLSKINPEDEALDI